ncbi:MAG: META domain-containing protein [Rikenellaceae bacterium]|nr:META domain-containing protein [Rikenellaceae bacterium]
MKKSIIMTGAASLLLLISSCCGCRGGKSVSHTLTSDSWKLVELGGGEKLAASNDDSYTITFVDGDESRVFGCGDCNRYFGSYKEEATHRLTFSHMGSTRMMCPNQEGEDKFFTALDKVDSYTIDGDNLMLQNNGDVVAIFEAIPLINVEK